MTDRPTIPTDQYLVGVDGDPSIGPSPWLLKREDGGLTTCHTAGAATDFGSQQAADAAREAFISSGHPSSGLPWAVYRGPKP
jgi:hypothetical protein